MVSGKITSKTESQNLTLEEKDTEKSKDPEGEDEEDQGGFEDSQDDGYHQEGKSKQKGRDADQNHLHQGDKKRARILQEEEPEEDFFEEQEEKFYSREGPKRDQNKIRYDTNQQIDEKNDEEEDSPPGREEHYEGLEEYKEGSEEAEGQEGEWSQYQNPQKMPQYSQGHYQQAYYQPLAHPRERAHHPHPPQGYTGEERANPKYPYRSPNDPYWYPQTAYPQQGNFYPPHPAQPYYAGFNHQHIPNTGYGPQPPYPYQAQQTEQSNRGSHPLANLPPGYQEVSSPFSKSSNRSRPLHSHASSEHCQQNRYPYESPQYFYLQKMPRFDPRVHPPTSFSPYLANPQQSGPPNAHFPSTQSQTHRQESLDLSLKEEDASYDHFAPSPLSKLVPRPRNNGRFGRTQSYLINKGEEHELNIGTPQHSTHVQEFLKDPMMTPQHQPRAQTKSIRSNGNFTHLFNQAKNN